MTDKPRSEKSDYDDPLSLFAPEASAPQLDERLFVEPDVSGARNEREAESAVQFHVEQRGVFERRAPMPPPPVWRREGSASVGLSKLTLAFSVLSVTALLTGWFLTRGAEPLGTVAHTAAPDVAQSVQPPKVVLPETRVERPAPPAETRSRRETAAAPNRPAQPSVAAAAPPVPSISRPPITNPSAPRDPVTPASRVAPLTSPIIIAPPAAPASTASSSVAANPPVSTAGPPSTTPEPAATTFVPEPSPVITAAPPPPPSPAAAPPPAAAETEVARVTPRSEISPAQTRSVRIESALSGYRDALGALNPTAVRAVWPSADVKGIARAFDQLHEQKLQLDNCRIAPMGSTAAVATCAGTLRYVPKTGNKAPRVERREYQFVLREESESWLIERVITR